MRSQLPLLITLLSFLVLVTAWSTEDHEIFRLRDEVEASEGPGVTFYDFLGISPSASQEDIHKAFRKNSKAIHPDKAKHSFIAARSTARRKVKGPSDKKTKSGVHVSKGPSDKEVQKAVKEATERFGRLGVVTNILKDDRRERYDHFLRNGFPKWRGTGYYYARFRPGLGSVLVGLFIVVGGAAHYGALVLSWKRQRDFVDRYIRHARKTAWGDETSIAGITGLDGATPAAAPSLPAEEESAAMQMNRKQKRQMEKEQKKDKSRKGGKAVGQRAGTQTLPSTSAPTGQKKRVMAQNGKVLIVDSIGNVYLEEEDEDGTTQEFLLDVDEIPRPTIRDTALYKLPASVYKNALGRFLNSTGAVDASEGRALSTQEDSQGQGPDSGFKMIPESNVEKAAISMNGNAKKRKQKGKN